MQFEGKKIKWCVSMRIISNSLLQTCDIFASFVGRPAPATRENHTIYMCINIRMRNKTNRKFRFMQTIRWKHIEIWKASLQINYEKSKRK